MCFAPMSDWAPPDEPDPGFPKIGMLVLVYVAAPVTPTLVGQ